MVDCIACMLELNPEKRMDVSQVLMHQWFRPEAKKSLIGSQVAVTP